MGAKNNADTHKFSSKSLRKVSPMQAKYCTNDEKKEKTTVVKAISSHEVKNLVRVSTHY